MVIAPIRNRPLTLVSGDRPIDGKKWLIGNNRSILSSRLIQINEDADAIMTLAAGAARSLATTPSSCLPLLHQFPPSFIPFATDDYFIVGVADCAKRFVVLDYLHVDGSKEEEEEEEKRRREREAAAGRGGWSQLLGRVKKLKDGLQ